MAIDLQPKESQIWRIVQALIQVIRGRHNSSGRVILAANTTTTVVVAPNCSHLSEPQLSPRTASAATALATTWISTVADGSFTITHLNSVVADRTFGWIATGG